jgi:hypothetical protein
VPVLPGEAPGLLERLAEVPDPRDPRGVRHPLAVVLALAACAVLAGVTSLPAVGEWIADAPAHVLARLGVRPDPVLPARQRPSESAVRRLPARIDGDALDAAVGRRLADRRPHAAGPRAPAVDGKSLRGAAKDGGRRATCSPPWTTPPAWSWPSSTSATRPARSPASSRCWARSPTSPGSW